ncbi:methyl-accepting chemotaxis protein [Shewanella sp. SR44-3]|uniref:methyl-accepting chemotaxis protein n=1 Tax=Shewanella sp. SR44-3 TaxID=2760936 RepID=UPI0015F7D5D0|nr:methyl-accepting chemotaxis protein [Shewanella sp. SR44-3]MBB1268279.1 methyl-accepting chemotaxis protein [Shewanella sp. SR44-3]
MSEIFNSIKAKIFMGYATLLLMTLIAASLLAVSNESVNDKTNAFIATTLPSLTSLNQLEMTTKELVIIGYSLYGTTLNGQEFTDKRTELMTVLMAEQAKLKGLGVSGLDKGIADLGVALDALAEVMTKNSVDWDLARDKLNLLSDSASKLKASLMSLSSEVSNSAEQRSGEIQAQLSDSTLLIMLLVSVTIIVSLLAYILAKSQIASPIQSLASQLITIAKNRNLKGQLPIASVSEIGTVACSINGLIEVFHQGMVDVNDAIDSINSAVRQLSDSSSTSTHSVKQLKGNINELVAVMDRLEDHMQQSLSHSEEAATAAQNGAKSMADSQQGVVATADSIGELANDIEKTSEMLLTLQTAGDQVSDVVKTIADIAAQTNLLALNAAIEAARAGETGRGFAVVADEVRTLASRTHHSTVEINQMLEKIVQSIQGAVGNMNSNREKAQVSVSLTNQLVNSLEESRQVILSLASVSQEAAELASGAQQEASRVQRQVQTFQALGDEVSSGTQTVEHTGQSLAELASRLSVRVKQFKI